MRRLRICALALLITGCDFSSPVDIDLPEYTPLLVVGGFLEEGRPIEVRFGRSAGSEELSSAATPYLASGVTAIIYDEKGTVLDTLQSALPLPGTPYPRYVSSIVAEGGRRYRLSAEVEGLPPITAETLIPQPASITVVNTGLRTLDGLDNLFRVVSVDWDDLEGETVYALTVFDEARADGALGGRIPFLSDDLDLRKDYDGLGRPLIVDPRLGSGPREFTGAAFLNDETFVSGSKSVEILIVTEANAYVADVGIAVLSPEMVRYMTALRIQGLTVNDPFTEPTQAYTNIENGLGAFVGLAVVTRPVEIRP